MKINISILVATFNGERFLPDLLLSLAQQTYQPIEIVFCDDGSSDQTISILEEFARSSPINSKVVRNQETKGYARNFLEGMSLCRGDYVAFCDQDDVWKKNKLERLVTMINPDKTPSMVFSDCELVDSELRSLNQTAIGFSGITSRQKNEIMQGNLIKILIKHPLIPGMCMLVNRARVLKNLPLPYGLMHDHALSAGFSIGGDYAYVEDSLVLYRQHSKNAIGMSNCSRFKRKKKRGPIHGKNYSKEVNADLNANLELLRFLLYFKGNQSEQHHEHTSLVEQLLRLKLIRLKRRSCFVSLFVPLSNAAKQLMTPKELRRIWLKDFRCYFRLKFSRFIVFLIICMRILFSIRRNDSEQITNYSS